MPRVKDRSHRQPAASHDRLAVVLPGTARPDNLPRADSRGIVAFEQLDLDQIQDVAQAKRAIIGLLNLVEDLQATVRALQTEVQRLRDENTPPEG